VALFFATEDPLKLEKDGVVWCVHRLETNKHLPRKLKNILDNEVRTSLFHEEGLSSHFPTLEAFDKRCPANSLLWFEPPSANTRIINQYAFFSVMPRVDSDHAAWLSQYPELHWIVPVPQELKKEIRDRLLVMNISERTIYPGLEGIARWQNVYYSGESSHAKVRASGSKAKGRRTRRSTEQP
jgi:hypothetical protein